MIHGAVTAGLGAANLLGHLTMSTEETPHELSPEHAGFRAEHESFKAGILGLMVTVGLTTGLMAYFVRKNEQEHKKLQAQLDDLLGLVEDHETVLETQENRDRAHAIFDKWRTPESSHRGLPVFVRSAS